MADPAASRLTDGSSAALRVFVSTKAAYLSLRAAVIFADLARAAVADRGQFNVALAGGSTPEGMYRDLASLHTSGEAGPLPWQFVQIFFGDERYVPHDDPQSNYRMARETLLSRVPIPESKIHPMPTDAADPNASAAAYEQTLRTALQLKPGELPRLDLVLLGLGPEGHTASLFPGSEALRESRRLVVAPWVEKFSTYRLTLTPPVLCNAREVWFLVSGPKKAEILHEVLEGPPDPDRLPAQIVRPTHGTLRWLVDREAAARLTLPTYEL